MKHLKSITELNSETYDKISQSASKRGDIRGKRISDTAEELKNRNDEWLEIERKKNFEELPNIEVSTDQSLANNVKIQVKILDIKSPFDNSQMKELTCVSLDGKQNLTLIIDTKKALKDRIVTSNGKSVNLSRKSARDLSKIFKDFYGIEIQPNEFSQH